jgi:hypothetical protein
MVLQGLFPRTLGRPRKGGAARAREYRTKSLNFQPTHGTIPRPLGRDFAVSVAQAAERQLPPSGSRRLGYELEDVSLPADDLGGRSTRWQMSALAAVYWVLSELRQRSVAGWCQVV